MPKITDQIKGNSTPLLVLVLIGAAFFIGRLSAQVEALKSGAPAAAPQVQVGDQQPAAPTVGMDQIKGLFKKDLVKFGDENKKVLFVEVSDPSCPYCSIAAGKNSKLNNQDDRFKLKADGGTYLAPVAEMKKLLDKGQIGYVWIYSNGHGNGELAAKALYCANEKGKFWNAHDLLFTAEGYDLINNTVKNDVTKIGVLADFLKKAVDSNFIKSCLESKKYDDRLQADIAIAQGLGVNGTPGFFVNTTNYPGAVNFANMQSVVDAALK